MKPTRKIKKNPEFDEQISKSIDIVKDGLQSSKNKIDEALSKTYDLLKNC